MERQAKLERLSAERERLVVQQRQQQQQLQAQMATQQVAQQQKVGALRADQAERAGGIRAAGNAAASSLRILAQGQPSAPTAQVSSRSTAAGVPRSTRASLSIGRTRRSAGSGSNLSV